MESSITLSAYNGFVYCLEVIIFNTAKDIWLEYTAPVV